MQKNEILAVESALEKLQALTITRANHLRGARKKHEESDKGPRGISCFIFMCVSKYDVLNNSLYS